MASSPVQSRYKLYKAGTTKIVQWLAKTAGACCDLTTILKSLKSRPRKNHKNSKSKWKKNPAEKFEDHGPIHILTSELVTLAEQIISANPPITISSSILRILSDVISGRQACADWYASPAMKGHPELQKQNEGHVHFIRILQDVHDILSTAKAAQDARTPAKTTKLASPDTQNRENKLSRLFACLKIEEPTESPLGEAPEPSMRQFTPNLDAQNARFELKDEEESVALELWCLIEDLNDMRSFVHDTWMHFISGQLTMLAATLTSDTAFGLMRRSFEDFVSKHPKFDDYNGITSFLGIGTLIHNGRVTAIPHYPDLSSKNPRQGLELDDVLCQSAHITLSTFIEKAVSWRPGMTVEQLNTQTPGQFSMAYVFEDLGYIIFNMIPSIVSSARTLKANRQNVNRSGIGDEFLRGLMNFSLDGRIPLWLVVAYQTYIDFSRYVRYQSTVPEELLREWLEESKFRLTSYSTFYPKFHDCLLEPTWQLDLRMDSVQASSILQDLRSGETTRNEVDEMQFQSLTELPIGACVLLYHKKARQHDIGALIANDGFVILAVAHLYKFARQHGLVTFTWGDMELLIDKHKLVTDAIATASPDEFAKGYQRALGVPQSALGRHKGATYTSLKTLVKNHRKIQSTSELITGMTKHADRDAKSKFRTAETIQVVLHNLTRQDTSEKATGNRDKYENKFTPIELLSTFKKNFLADELMLNFDYIGFFQTCALFLKPLSFTIPAERRKDFEHLKRNYELMEYMFWDAAKAMHEQLPLQDTLIAEVATLLETTMSDRANHFSKLASDESSACAEKDLKYFKPFSACLDEWAKTDFAADQAPAEIIDMVMGESEGSTDEERRANAVQWFQTLTEILPPPSSKDGEDYESDMVAKIKKLAKSIGDRKLERDGAAMSQTPKA